MAGDDLVDDFVPDDLVALSDPEEDVDLSTEDSPFNNELGEATTSPPASPTSSNPSAKRKRRQKEKERRAKKRRLTEPGFGEDDILQQNLRFAIPPSALHDYLSQRQIKAWNELSSIELEEFRIPEACIADTTSWTGSRSLDLLPEFIAKLLPNLKTRLGQRPKHNGAPTLIFIASAALRVADATRILKRMKDDSQSLKAGDIAKLFGKHFKLEEHANYVRRTRIGAAVGTPGRIGKLLCETESLSLSALTHIIIDTTFQDAKKRNIFDIPETCNEIFRLVLGSTAMRAAIATGNLSIVLF